MSIERIEVIPLKVQGMVAYKAIRKPGNPADPHGDMVEYYNILKNETDPEMKQINVSRSVKNAIRGVHVAPYHKIAFCPVGKIYDVCVDLRPNSPTFMQWDGCWIDKDTHVIVPPYCAHGVFSAEEDSCLCYYQGGCFFPHLDFAVNPMDPQIGIKWPKPIDADDYVLSEKDRTSSPVTPELVEKLKYRIEHPIEDRQTNTNSDFVVICNTSAYALPIFDALEKGGFKGHLLAQTAFKRETLHARLVSLRPKYSTIYVVETAGKDALDISTEVMNLAAVCHEVGSHLTVVFDSEDFDGADIVLNFLREECNDFALVIVGHTILSRSMTAEAAAAVLKANERTLERFPTVVDFDIAAPNIVRRAQAKETGVNMAGAGGQLDLGAVAEFCRAHGVEFSAKTDCKFEGCPKQGEANETFKKLIADLK